MPRLVVMCVLCSIIPAPAPAGDAVSRAARQLAPDSEVVGELQWVNARHEDTLIDIALAHGVGYLAILNANPEVDVWLPGAGTRVVLPRSHVLPRARRSDIVINLPEMRLYDFTVGNGEVMTYPVSIGRMDWSTPLGTLTVIEKTKRPSWYPPPSIRAAYAARGEILPGVVPPGPDNPLGEFSLRLSNPSYLIHGTNRADGIGMRATHGCIRLGPDDIEHLFRHTPIGTRVHFVNEPLKAGWSGDTLYLEAHPVLEEFEEPSDLTPAVRAVVAATEKRSARVDWAAVERVVAARSGIPEPVGVLEIRPAPAAGAATARAIPRSGEIPPGWYLQLGSFRDADNARRLAVRLEEAGFAVQLGELRHDGRTVTRVLIGPEADESSARSRGDRLRRAVGEHGRVVRMGMDEPPADPGPATDARAREPVGTRAPTGPHALQ